jgi:hypothetical protein
VHACIRHLQHATTCTGLAVRVSGRLHYIMAALLASAMAFERSHGIFVAVACKTRLGYMAARGLTVASTLSLSWCLYRFPTMCATGSCLCLPHLNSLLLLTRLIPTTDCIRLGRPPPRRWDLHLFAFTIAYASKCGEHAIRPQTCPPYRRYHTSLIRVR